MDYQRDYFSLQPIYDYVKTIQRLPKRNRSKKSEYGKYRCVYLSLILNVPNIPGWYLWVNINSPKKEIYTGKAFKGLHNRFQNRFKQEYTVFWETVHGEYPFITDAYRIFPQEDYREQIEGYRCKCNSTHIIWVGRHNIDKYECEDIERELFISLDPLCNIDRPKPKGVYRNNSIMVSKIIKNLLSKIKENTH